MTLRFPEDPTSDERAAFKSYFFLQARLYPCGECAAEFMQLLSKYPPQTSSRKVASLWYVVLRVTIVRSDEPLIGYVIYIIWLMRDSGKMCSTAVS